MPSQQELNNQKEYNRLLQEARDLAAKIGIPEEVEETMANLADDIKGAKRYVNDLGREWNEFSSDVAGVSNTFKNIVDDIKKSSSAVGDTTKGFKNLSDIGNKLLNSQRGYNKLSSDQIKDLQKKALLERDAIKDNLSRLGIAKNEAEANLKAAQARGNTSEIKKYQKELAKITTAEGESKALLEGKQSSFNALLDQLGKEEDKVNKINKAMGLTGVAAQGISTLLNKAGFGSLAGALKIDEVKEQVEGELLESLKEVNEETGEITYRTATFGEKVAAASKLVSGLGSNLVKNLTDPLAIGTFLMTQIVDAFMMVDKTSGDIAKSLGTSIGNARQVSDRMNDIATSSGNIFVTTKNLSESYIALNDQFGTSVSLTNKQLESFTKLTKQAGMSVEAAREFDNIAVSIGSNSEDVASNFLGSAKAAALNNGVLLSNKEITESIKDLSAATLLSLEQNPEALGNAVGVAKSLGMEMKQIEGIASNLLNFEQSISAELEAELLTGKQLNLETARLAALNNDVATVAEEVSKQIGSAAEFGKMNVLQQEALAKSVGMERNELAKMLKDKEVMTKLSGVEGKTAQERFNNLVKEVGMEEAKRRLGDESLANQYEQANAQEKFAQSVEQLKEVFVSLVEPLMPVIDVFADIMALISPIVAMVGKLVKLISGPLVTGLAIVVGSIKAFEFTMTGISTIQKLILAQTEAQAVAEGQLGFFGKARLAIENLLFSKKVQGNAQAALELSTEEGKVSLKQLHLALENETFMTKLRAYGIVAKNFVKEKASAAMQKVKLGLEKAGVLQKLKSSALSVKDVALEKGKVAIQKGSLAIQYLINGAKRVANILSSKNLLKGAANMLVGVGRFAINAAASVARIPYIGPILAIAAAAAAVAGGMALYNKFKKADDLMSPGQGMAGYGKRTLLAPEGAFALNNRDTVVAGTNLDRPSTGIAPPQPQAAPVQQAAAPAQSAPQQSEIKNNTSVTVKMDADKLGMASAKSSNRIQ